MRAAAHALRGEGLTLCLLSALAPTPSHLLRRLGENLRRRNRFYGARLNLRDPPRDLAIPRVTVLITVVTPRGNFRPLRAFPKVGRPAMLR